MPSPFPGMDPFLEHPEVFPDVHDRLITRMSESLNARLPEPYYAKLGRRLWVEISERFVGPDVNLLRNNGGPGGPGARSAGTAEALAVRTPPGVVPVPHDEIRETFVELSTRRG